MPGSDQGNDDAILDAMARTNAAAYKSIMEEREQAVRFDIDARSHNSNENGRKASAK